MKPRVRERARASIVGVFFLLVSVWTCAEALQVPLGSVRMPGAGFFPLLLGVSLGLLSLVLLGASLLVPAGAATSFRPERSTVLYLAASLVAAVVLFERAGFVITMALFAAVAMKILGPMSWLTAAGLGVVGSVVAYLVFGRLLLIALPSGILPF
jgi:hypothetical protein